MLTDDGHSRPWWKEPKPVMQHSGTGYDSEARIVTPDEMSEPEPEPWLDSWSPEFSAQRVGRSHGVPPSPRR